MVPTPQQIRAELDADPLGRGYAGPLAARSWQALADLLNAKQYRGPVPIVELSAYCVTRGIIGACEVASTNTALPAELRALCVTTTTLLRDDSRLTTADVDDPLFGAACDGLVSGGLMTADNKAAMLALAANRASRAEILWGHGTAVSAQQVREAGRLT